MTAACDAHISQMTPVPLFDVLHDGEFLHRITGAMGFHLQPHMLMECSRHPVESEFFALKFDDQPIVIGLGCGMQESHAGKPGLGRDRRAKDITEGLSSSGPAPG